MHEGKKALEDQKRASKILNVEMPLPISAMPSVHAYVAELEEALSGKTMHDARNEALEEAAKVAEYAHMVPPDGGSPTKEEVDVAINAAAAIRALKT